MKKLSILIVDDEPLITKILARMLRAHHVRIATEYEVALTEIADGPIDVLISDLRMPGGDGRDLLNEARRQHPAVRCVLMSGMDADDATESRQADLDAVDLFLPKPFPPRSKELVLELAA